MLDIGTEKAHNSLTMQNDDIKNNILKATEPFNLATVYNRVRATGDRAAWIKANRALRELLEEGKIAKITRGRDEGQFTLKTA